MKKYSFKSIIATALFLASAVTLSAADYTIDGIAYNILTDTPGVYEAEVTSGGKYTGHVTIPGSIYLGGLPYKVTRIGEYAFYNCNGMTGITLPSSLVKIGNYAFYGCSGLSEITLPASVTTLCERAFCSCYNLTDISLSTSLATIGDFTFENCSRLTSITITRNVTSIGQHAFLCENLKEITVDSNNTHFISQDGVLYNHAMDTLVIYPRAKEGDYTISDKTKVILPNAFYKCDKLSSIIIPDNVTTVGSSAFSNCANLVSVELSQNMTAIESNLFSNCDRLKNVKIKEGITYLGSSAFNSCDSLQCITLPSTVTKMEWGCLSYCHKLEDIYFNKSSSLSSASDPFYDSDNVKLHVPSWFIDNYGQTWFNVKCLEYKFRDATDQREYEIWYKTSDGSILTLPDVNAFDAKLLSNTYQDGQGVLTFEHMVTSLDDGAFRNCTSLTSIILPDGVKSIGDNTFNGCTSLSECSLPYSLMTIGMSSFAGCPNLKQFSGADLSTDRRCFIHNRILLAVAPGELTTFSIPDDGSIAAISTGAFSGCSELTEITIPDAVTTIAGGVLAGCIQLSTINCKDATSDHGALIQENILKAIAPAGVTSYTVPETVNAIDAYCFAGLTTLTDISIGENVTSLGEGTFQGCTGLTQGSVPSHIKAWPKKLFKDCTGLINAVIPESVTSIGDGIFHGCSNMKSVTYNAQDATVKCNNAEYMLSIFPLTVSRGIIIGDKVQTVPSYLFGNNTSLRTIKIPDNVTSLGEKIFLGCTNLDSIYCTANPPMTCLDNTFSGMGINAHIYVPDELLSTYESASVWNGFSWLIHPMGVSKEKSYIYYTSFDGTVVTPADPSAFDCKIYSNTYQDGRGVIVFAGILKSIGIKAFKSCRNLKNVDLPASVTEINSEAFCGNQIDSFVCRSVTPPVMPNSALNYYDSGRKIFVPQASLSAYEQAEGWNPYRNSILSIQEGQAVPQEIHYTSTNGKTVTPNYIHSVKILSNTYIDGQGTWTVDREMTVIEENAFKGINTLKSITIPATVLSIKDDAFRECSNLDSVGLMTGLQSIGNTAFYYCSSLKSVILPSTLNRLGTSAFDGCSKLEVVWCKPVTPPYCSCSGCDYFASNASGRKFYIQEQSLPQYTSASGWSRYASDFYSDGGKTYEIHYITTDSLTVELSSGAMGYAKLLSNTYGNGKGTLVFDRPITTFSFRNCSTLVSVELPEYITAISSEAFYNCTSLTGINLPKTITDIGYRAFGGCRSLAEVVLPDSLKSMDSYAFEYCSALKSITLPNNLSNISSRAFGGCTNLKAVYCTRAIPPQLSWSVFENIPTEANIYIPEAYFSAYENADYWKDYKSHMCMLSDKKYEMYYTSVDNKAVTPNSDSFNARILSNVYEKGQGIISFDRPLKSIGSNAFEGKDRLSAITIPDSVTEIGSCAFYGCSLLKTCDLPEGITRIGANAFYGCYTWPGCTLPSTLEVIEPGAFLNCTSIKSITLPPKVKTIYEYTFNGCKNLKTLNADSVTELKEYALSGCGLESFTIPSGVKVINQGVFQSSSIKEIIIQSGIEKIESYAFSNCNNLEEITIPEGFTKVPEGLLQSCNALVSVNLPSTIDSICDNAFQYCQNLKSVTLPDKLEFIGKYAFQSCVELTAITLPEHVKMIDQYAFESTRSLTCLYCKSTEPVTLISPNIFSDSKYFIVPAASLDRYKSAAIWENFKDWIYPDDFQAFEMHYTSTDGSTITPNGLCKTEGTNSYQELKPFYNKYEDGIGTWGFTDTIVYIQSSAFNSYQSLESITLPATIKRIDNHAFYYCQNLKKVTCLSTTPPTLEYNVFEENAADRVILVPDASVSDYEKANNWSTYKSSIFSSSYTGDDRYTITYTADAAIIPDVSESDGFGGAKLFTSTFSDGKGTLLFDRRITKIAKNAFKDKMLKSINLPDSLTRIGESAFEGCTHLTSIRIPKLVTEIGSNAFNGCTSLDSVVCLGATPPSCLSGAFDDNADNRIIYVDAQYVSDYEKQWVSYKNSIFANTKEKSVIYYTSNGNATITPTDVSALGAKVLANTETRGGKRVMQLDRVLTDIGVGAFAGQNRLESIELPEGLKSIGANSFRQCMSLQSITLPQTLQEIGVDAFDECKALQTITIPASVTKVGAEAFLNCSSLKKVYSKSVTPPTCGSDAFDGNTANRRICVPDSSVTTYRKASGWSEYKVYIVGENSASAKSEEEIAIVETPIIKLYNHLVTITCGTSGATIHYTTDGTDPTESSPVYTDVIKIDRNCTVQAYATKDACFDSGTASLDCEDFIVQMPVVTLENDYITITCGTDKATIYYTVNGTEPTINSDVYDKPFAISENLTIKAMATLSDYTNSSVTTYTVDEFYAAAPVITADEENILISISCATEGAKIYYTTDGTAPTTRSTQYTKPFDPKSNCVVKAMAACTGLNNSTTTSYQVELYSTAAPVITLTEDADIVKVNITCSTSGATIRYTLDNTNPDAFSQQYQGTFNCEENTIIKAYATSGSLSDSKIVTKQISSFKVETPVIDSIGGKVTITCPTAQNIYYTTDGSVPTKGSKQYKEAIEIQHNLYVRAIGIRNNFNDSEVAMMDIELFKVKTPSINYQEGGVIFSCDDRLAKIFYLIHGSTYMELWASYDGTSSIAIQAGDSIWAFGKRTDYTNSDTTMLVTYSADCGKPSIRFNGEQFWFETDGETDAVYYTVDGSYPTVKSNRYAGNKVTLDNLGTIRAIAVKTGKNNSSAAELKPSYIFRRSEMKATLTEAGKLQECFEWCETPLTDATVSINGSLNEADLRFIRQSGKFCHIDLSESTLPGNSLPDSCFSGSSLVSIILPSTMEKAGEGLFSNCPCLAAVVWDANLLVPDKSMDGIVNPNMLLYVTSQVYAPTNVSNIVSNSNASQITLTSTEGNCNFYAPRDFTAYSISYTKDFEQETEVNQCSGWESISLPFEVQTIRHASKGQITPFGASSTGNRHFWLYGLSATGFVSETAIQAYRPYLISMPHNTVYASASDLGGKVTFSASYTTVLATTKDNFQMNKKGAFYFQPNFIQKDKDEKYLVLNVGQKYNDNLAGSVFVAGLKDVKPFEGYIETADVQNAAIFRISGDVTGIDAVGADIREVLTLTAGHCMIRIEANEATTAAVYSMDGKLVQHLTMNKGEVIELPLEPGLYMVGNRRVMVKD